MLPLAALHQQARVPPLGEGALTGALACYGFYGTSDGRHVGVGALERKFWDALCRQLERPDLAPLHRTGDAATEQRLRDELASIFATRPLAHWAAAFEGVEACVTPVLRLDETLAHPHFRARGFGNEPVPAAPRPGEHTQQVLHAAGFGADEIAALRAAGTVA